MATHPSILAWRIPWTEEPAGVRRVAESDTKLIPSVEIDGEKRVRNALSGRNLKDQEEKT